ncbi:MAG: hypothetical protein R3309_16460, partial [Reinekea sp.]|nr:hypothetical protein [Reinekea sp.]
RHVATDSRAWMPLEAPRVQGRTLKRPFEESVRHGSTPKRATEGGARGSPLERKHSLRELLVKNGTIVFETDLVLEVKKLSETKSHIDANTIEQASLRTIRVRP